MLHLWRSLSTAALVFMTVCWNICKNVSNVSWLSVHFNFTLVSFSNYSITAGIYKQNVFRKYKSSLCLPWPFYVFLSLYNMLHEKSVTHNQRGVILCGFVTRETNVISQMVDGKSGSIPAVCHPVSCHVTVNVSFFFFFFLNVWPQSLL